MKINGAHVLPAESVAVFATLGRDAAVMTDLLVGAGVHGVRVSDWKEVRASFDQLGMLLMTEESASGSQLEELSDLLDGQPPWSELPVLVLLSAGRTTVSAMRPELSALLSRPGVVLQRRPVPSIALLSTVRAALRGRARQHAVRSLLVRERESRDQALAATRMKDEFLAVVSHELRTPVSAILMWGHVLEDASLDDEQLKAGVASILRSATTQQHLIEDLLDLGRMLTGTLRIAPKLQPLAPLVEAAIATVRPAAEAKGVQLSVHTRDERRLFAVDALRMQQVFWNLLGNAVKFTPRGGKVSVTIEPHADHASVVVEDTGQGIASDLLPEVFDRFRQGEGGTSRRQGGLGLGLAIVRQLVQLHGAEVEASSAGLGKGASFAVRIPVPGERRPKSTPPTAHEAARKPLTGARLLLVEDDSELRMALAWMLESAGAEVLAVESTDAALAALRTADPSARVHVLLSDLGLPERDGCELMRAVRADPIHAALPAIAISARPDAAQQERAPAAGFQRFLSKPITPSGLLSAVRTLRGQ